MAKQTPTNAQLSGEIAALRRRLAELEALEAEHRRAEHVQSALYRIADAASAAEDMPAFYAAMHGIVGEWYFPTQLLFVFSLAERKNEQQKEDTVPLCMTTSGHRLIW